MQMYEGLPIITNKISVAERKGVPHHLLGCVKSTEEPWTVGVFVEKALAVVGKMPCLVVFMPYVVLIHGLDRSVIYMPEASCLYSLVEHTTTCNRC